MNIIINKILAGRTIKEWRVDNIENIKQYRADYIENIKLNHNKKITFECGNTYFNLHKCHHIKTIKNNNN